MKFKIKRQDLSAAIGFCSKAITSTPVYPLLGCYRLKVEKGFMNVMATNNQYSMSQKFACEGDGDFGVQADKLNAIVKQLPNQELQFELKDQKLTIKHSTGKFVLPTEDGKDFSEIKNKVKSTLAVDGSVFSNAIEKSLWAVPDKPDHILGNLNVAFGKDLMTVTGCSQHVVATFDYAIESNVEENICLAKNSCRILTGLSGKYSVIISDNSIGLYNENSSIIIVKSDGEYPDFKQFIPVDNDKFLNLETSSLKSAIQRTKTLSNKDSFLRMDTGSKLVITGEDENLEQQAVEEINVEYDGEEMSIGCDAGYAIDILSHMQSETTFAQLLAPHRPIIFREEFLETQEKKNLFLLMPMMIQNQN